MKRRHVRLVLLAVAFAAGLPAARAVLGASTGWASIASYALGGGVGVVRAERAAVRRRPKRV